MINIESKCSGFYTIRKGKVGQPSVVVASFSNIVTDTGLVRMGVNGDYLSRCSIGSGGTPAAPTDTTLAAKLRDVASSAITGGTDNTVPSAPFVWIRITTRFNPTGSAYNVAEVGMGWDATNVFSRALIKDSGGSPMVISVLGDEYLDVTFELRLYPPMGDFTGSSTPTGDDTAVRTYTARACKILNNIQAKGWTLHASTGGSAPILGQFSNDSEVYSGAIGAVSEEPTGSITGGLGITSTMTTGASGDMKINLGLTQSVGTIRSFVFASHACCFQLQVDPPFVKTGEDLFEITVNHSWGRK